MLGSLVLNHRGLVAGDKATVGEVTCLLAYLRYTHGVHVVDGATAVELAVADLAAVEEVGLTRHALVEPVLSGVLVAQDTAIRAEQVRLLSQY